MGKLVMGENAGHQAVMSLFIVEFHILEEHFARLEPKRVAPDNECGVDYILDKIAVFKYGLTLHVQTGYLTEQTQMTYGTSSHIPEYGFCPMADEMQVGMIGIQRYVYVFGLGNEITVESCGCHTFIGHGTL